MGELSESIDGDTIDGWELNVCGKGSKNRVIVVSYEIINQLAHYLESQGLDIDPATASNRGAHLIGKVVDLADTAPWLPAHIKNVDRHVGITASTLQVQLKNSSATVPRSSMTQTIAQSCALKKPPRTGCVIRMARTLSPLAFRLMS